MAVLALELAADIELLSEVVNQTSCIESGDILSSRTKEGRRHFWKLVSTARSHIGSVDEVV
jgi:hypothetical protein